jgi:hypothetical protein
MSTHQTIPLLQIASLGLFAPATRFVQSRDVFERVFLAIVCVILLLGHGILSFLLPVHWGLALILHGVLSLVPLLRGSSWLGISFQYKHWYLGLAAPLVLLSAVFYSTSMGTRLLRLPSGLILDTAGAWFDGKGLGWGFVWAVGILVFWAIWGFWVLGVHFATQSKNGLPSIKGMQSAILFGLFLPCCVLLNGFYCLQGPMDLRLWQADRVELQGKTVFGVVHGGESGWKQALQKRLAAVSILTKRLPGNSMQGELTQEAEFLRYVTGEAWHAYWPVLQVMDGLDLPGGLGKDWFTLYGGIALASKPYRDVNAFKSALLLVSNQGKVTIPSPKSRLQLLGILEQMQVPYYLDGNVGFLELDSGRYTPKTPITPFIRMSDNSVVYLAFIPERQSFLVADSYYLFAYNSDSKLQTRFVNTIREESLAKVQAGILAEGGVILRLGISYSKRDNPNELNHLGAEVEFDTNSQRDTNYRPDTNYHGDTNYHPGANYHGDTNYHRALNSQRDTNYRPDTNYHRALNYQHDINCHPDRNSHCDTNSHRDTNYHGDTNYHCDTNSQQNPSFSSHFGALAAFKEWQLVKAQGLEHEPEVQHFLGQKYGYDRLPSVFLQAMVRNTQVLWDSVLQDRAFRAARVLEHRAKIWTAQPEEILIYRNLLAETGQWDNALRWVNRNYAFLQAKGFSEYELAQMKLNQCLRVSLEDSCWQVWDTLPKSQIPNTPSAHYWSILRQDNGAPEDIAEFLHVLYDYPLYDLSYLFLDSALTPSWLWNWKRRLHE